MAALSLRLRRALTISSSLLNDRHLFSLFPSTPSPLGPPKPYPPLVGNPSSRPPHSLIQAQSFRSSAFHNNRFDKNEEEFDGCDYKHWLITMDFPKDPVPSRLDMIGTYFETATVVFGSWREAQKKIYALSTTTYHGFQCLMDMATSKKFRGLPGVVSIDPDRYIDPVKKEYGGDKFEYGIIIPRHPQHFIRGYRRPNQDGRGYVRPKQDGRGYFKPLHDGRGYGQLQDGMDFGQLLQDGRGFGHWQGLLEGDGHGGGRGCGGGRKYCISCMQQD